MDASHVCSNLTTMLGQLLVTGKNSESLNSTLKSEPSYSRWYNVVGKDKELEAFRRVSKLQTPFFCTATRLWRGGTVALDVLTKQLWLNRVAASNSLFLLLLLETGENIINQHESTVYHAKQYL